MLINKNTNVINYNNNQKMQSFGNTNTIESGNKFPDKKHLVRDYSALGCGVGFLSWFTIHDNDDNGVWKLALKKLGLGICIGAVTGLLSNIISKSGEKNKEEQAHYTNIASTVEKIGIGAALGSTFLTFSAGGYHFFEKLKKVPMATIGGSIGGGIGALISLNKIYKKNSTSATK